MGKAFLYGSKKKNTSPNAELTVKCPANTLVRVQAKNTPTVIEKISDNECSAVFTGLNEDEYTVSLPGTDCSPTDTVVVDGIKKEIDMTYPVITINYPQGAVCTCQMGEHNYISPNTNGEWTIMLPEIGEWTITCDDGESIETSTVVIESSASAKTVDFNRINSYINVTYPRGSICTCSNDTITLTDNDTTGNCVFAVPSTGEWTVTATNGVESDSKVVTVEGDGETYNVEVVYDLWIISKVQTRTTEDLKTCWPTYADGYDAYARDTNVGSISFELNTSSISSAVIKSKHVYDLTDYNKLVITVSTMNLSSQAEDQIGYGIYGYETDASIVHGIITSNGYHGYIDISALCDSYYIGMSIPKLSNVCIRELYLEV